MTLSIMASYVMLSVIDIFLYYYADCRCAVVVLSVVMLSVVMLTVNYAEYHYTECRGAGRTKSGCNQEHFDSLTAL